MRKTEKTHTLIIFLILAFMLVEIYPSFAQMANVSVYSKGTAGYTNEIPLGTTLWVIPGQQLSFKVKVKENQVNCFTPYSDGLFGLYLENAPAGFGFSLDDKNNENTLNYLVNGTDFSFVHPVNSSILKNSSRDIKQELNITNTSEINTIKIKNIHINVPGTYDGSSFDFVLDTSTAPGNAITLFEIQYQKPAITWTDDFTPGEAMDFHLEYTSFSKPTRVELYFKNNLNFDSTPDATDTDVDEDGKFVCNYSPAGEGYVKMKVVYTNIDGTEVAVETDAKELEEKAGVKLFAKDESGFSAQDILGNTLWVVPGEKLSFKFELEEKEKNYFNNTRNELNFSLKKEGAPASPYLFLFDIGGSNALAFSKTGDGISFEYTNGNDLFGNADTEIKQQINQTGTGADNGTNISNTIQVENIHISVPQNVSEDETIDFLHAPFYEYEYVAGDDRELTLLQLKFQKPEITWTDDFTTTQDMNFHLNYNSFSIPDSCELYFSSTADDFGDTPVATDKVADGNNQFVCAYTPTENGYVKMKVYYPNNLVVETKPKVLDGVSTINLKSKKDGSYTEDHTLGESIWVVPGEQLSFKLTITEKLTDCFNPESNDTLGLYIKTGENVANFFTFSFEDKTNANELDYNIDGDGTPFEINKQYTSKNELFKQNNTAILQELNITGTSQTNTIEIENIHVNVPVGLVENKTAYFVLDTSGTVNKEEIGLLEMKCQKPVMTWDKTKKICAGESLNFTLSYKSFSEPDHCLLYFSEDGVDFDMVVKNTTPDLANSEFACSFAPVKNGFVKMRVNYNENGNVYAETDILELNNVLEFNRYELNQNIRLSLNSDTVNLLKEFDAGYTSEFNYAQKVNMQIDGVQGENKNLEYFITDNSEGKDYMFGRFWYEHKDADITTTTEKFSPKEDNVKFLPDKNMVHFYYGKVYRSLSDKVCFDTAITGISIVRGKILVPAESFCSYDDSLYDVVIDPAVIPIEVDSNHVATFEYYGYQLKKSDGTTFSSGDLAKFKFKPSSIWNNISMNGDDDLFVEVSAMAKATVRPKPMNCPPQWKGISAFVYKPGDRVTYNGVPYICTGNAKISDVPGESSVWEVYQLDLGCITSSWDFNREYEPFTLVCYGDTTYFNFDFIGEFEEAPGQNYKWQKYFFSRECKFPRYDSNSEYEMSRGVCYEGKEYYSQKFIPQNMSPENNSAWQSMEEYCRFDKWEPYDQDVYYSGDSVTYQGEIYVCDNVAKPLDEPPQTPWRRVGSCALSGDSLVTKYPYSSTFFYIYAPETDGKFLNLKNTYERLKTPITLACNYTIDSINGGGQGIEKDGEVWLFTPDKVLTGGENQAEIDLKLYYTDNHGCNYSITHNVKISEEFGEKPVFVVDNLEGNKCAEDYDFDLESSHPITSAKGYGIKGDTISGFKFNPYEAVKELGNNFTIPDSIFISFVDEKNTSYSDTFVVNFLPFIDAGFEVENICFGDSTLVKDTSIFIGDVGEGITRQWYFNDYTDTITYTGSGDDLLLFEHTHNGLTSGTYGSLVHIFKNPGIYNLFYRVITPGGCRDIETKKITIGKEPDINISSNGFIQNKESLFQNNTTAEPFDPIKEYLWDFDDDYDDNSTSKKNEIKYTFKNPGVHKVTLKAATQNQCLSVDTLKVPIYPLIRVNNDTLYHARFDTSRYDWIVSGEYLESAAGWKLEKAASPYSHMKVSGNIWLTSKPGNIIPNEKSWVESPCFNIDSLNFPMLSVDIYQSIEQGRDGAVLEYTLNDGDTWSLLSSGSTEVDFGMNWYNQKGIVSHPGSSENATSTGWSENTQQWKTARFPLDQLKQEIKDSSAACVRFRISYAGDAGTAEGQDIYGFGFDNFLVTERSRVVLIEQFVNSVFDKELMKSESAWLNKFMETKGEEAVNIRYHNQMAQYLSDPLFQINPPDISSRSFEYGASSVLKTVVDGVHKCSAEDEDGAEDEVEAYYNLRTLTDKRFDIDVKLENKDNKLYIKAKITKKVDTLIFESEASARECLVRMAIVQDTFVYENEIYQDVLVELLPNGVGNVVGEIPKDEPYGSVFECESYWEPNTTTIGNNFTLIVYVQNKWGLDEVQQTWFKKLELTEVPQVTKWPLKIEETNADLFGLYPVPVKDNMVIYTSHNFTSTVNWKLIDISGQVVKQGQMNKGEKRKTVNTVNLKSGTYIVLFENKQDSFIQRQKIIIVK